MTPSGLATPTVQTFRPTLMYYSFSRTSFCGGQHHLLRNQKKRQQILIITATFIFGHFLSHCRAFFKDFQTYPFSSIREIFLTKMSFLMRQSQSLAPKTPSEGYYSTYYQKSRQTSLVGNFNKTNAVKIKRKYVGKWFHVSLQLYLIVGIAPTSESSFTLALINHFW